MSESNLESPKSIKLLPLKAVLESVRAELIASTKGRGGSFHPMFELDEVTIELSVAFERQKKVGGKTNIFVAEFGAEGAEAQSTGHSVSFKMKVLSDDKRFKLRNTSNSDDHVYQGRKHKSK